MDGIAQGFEIGIHILDLARQIADLDDSSPFGANEIPLLQLVGQQKVTIIIISVLVQIFFRKLHHCRLLVLRARNAAEGPGGGQFVIGMGFDKVLFEDIAANQVMVIGNAVPIKQAGGEQVADVNALLPKGLGPRGAERRAE